MSSTIVQFQDLSSDKLLTSAARQTYDEKPVPSLGGIPLIAKLGQGGMGAVYVGMHPRLKQEVAVKVLPFPLLAQQPQMVERFFREAQIAAKIKSNHLVSVSDVNEEGGLFYIVMEFVNGTSAGSYLKQVFKSGAAGLSELEALTICMAATEGLAAAHAEQIVHRDVKPDNILIPRSKQGELLLKSAKLADLGLARGEETAGESLTGTRTALGTPGFMAPEQCMNAKKAKTPADVFSMGATLYALLTGRTPCRGETPMETLLATLQQPHTPLRQLRPDISTSTEALIDQTLEKEPSRRHADGAELLAALKACHDMVEFSRNQSAASATIVTKPTVARTAPASKFSSANAEPRSGLEATMVQSAGAASARREPEATMLATPQPAPPPPSSQPHTVPSSRVAHSSSATAKPVQPIRPANVSLFREPERKSRTGILALAGILAVAGGVGWIVLSHSNVPDQAATQPIEIPKKEIPVTAKPVTVSQPEVPAVKQPAPTETKTAVVVTPKLPPPVEAPKETPKTELTDDQKRQAVTDAMPKAQKADESGDWTQVVALLNGPVIQLGDLSHPSKAEAEALLLKARTEVMKRNDFLEKVKEAEKLLAEKKSEEAKALFEQAKTLCPSSPDIARANNGLNACAAALSGSRYQTAMAEGNKALEAQNFVEASRAFRRALEEKPSDATAAESLRQANAKAAEAATPKPIPKDTPGPEQPNQPPMPPLPPPPPDAPLGPDGKPRLPPPPPRR